MSDVLWWMLDHPCSHDLSALSMPSDYQTAMFDAAYYSKSRNVKFDTVEDAYADWRSVGRQLGCDFADGKNTVLKIVLKVKDEPELIKKWLDYHGAIVGFHNIIVMDCGSTNERFLAALEDYRSRVIIFSYTAYYDHIHQYLANRVFFDVIIRDCKYLTVLDADEFLFGVEDGAIAPQYVLSVLKSTSLACVCGTWFSNVSPIAELHTEINWNGPVSFGVDDHAIKWGSRQGKSLVRSTYMQEAKYTGHNIGDVRLSKFITPESFGKVGIFHLTALPPGLSKRRALQHLVSKGIVQNQASDDEKAEALREHLHSTNLKPIENLYISRYLGTQMDSKPSVEVFESRILADGPPESHKELEAWINFDFRALLADVQLASPVPVSTTALPKKIFEDEEISVFLQEGHSDFLLVTFGDLMNLVSGTKFSADVAVGKLGLNCIGFMAKRANWYPSTSMLAALPAVRGILEGFNERILYGGSMGGYAAIKFSSMLQASHVIAYCPQWSIDQEECSGRNPGWQQYFNPSMAKMGIRSADVSGQLWIFADGLNSTDAYHASEIERAHPGTTRFNVHLVDHHVTAVFAGTQFLGSILAACRAKDSLALAQLARQARRSSAIYAGNMLRRLGKRFPAQVWHRRDAFNLEKMAGSSTESVFTLAAALQAAGNLDEAASCLSLIQKSTCNPVDQLTAAATRASLVNTEIYIKTAHNLIVAFSPEQNKCVQTTRQLGLAGIFLFPVKIRLSGKIATVFYSTGQFGSIDLSVDSRGNLTNDFTGPATAFTISSTKPGRFMLQTAKNFLSAGQSAELICNRVNTGNWEQFEFG